MKNEAPAIVGDMGVSLVGAFRASHGTCLFRYNALNISPPPGFQDIVIAGSGATSFQRLLSDLPPQNLPITTTSSRLDEAVGKSLMLTGLLLHLEVGNRDSLLNFYGGGYEVAAHLKGRFTKIDDISYAFWYAEIENDGFRLHMPHAYMKAAYKEDVMLIRSFVPKATIEREFQRFEESFFIVPSFSSAKRKWTLDDRPSMISRFVCNYVWVANVPQRPGPGMLCIVDFVPKGAEIVRLEDVGDEGGMSLNQDYVVRLSTEIRRMHAQNV